MQIKKYIIFGMIGIIFSIGLAFYFLKYKSLSNSIVLNEIPEEFSRVAYFNIDEGLSKYLKNNDIPTMKEEMKEVVLSLEELALLELPETSGEPLALFRAGKDFDVGKLQELGVIKTGSNYVYESIGLNSFVYGKKSGVEKILEEEKDVSGDSDLEEYVSSVNDGDSNVFVVGDLRDLERGQGLPFKGGKYLAVKSFLSPSESYGSIDVIFEENFEEKLGISENFEFEPLLSKFSQKEDILYLELTDVSEFLGIPKEGLIAGFQTIAEDLLSGRSGALTQKDYESLVGILNGNIAIRVVNSQNLPYLGVGIILESKNVYSVFHKLYLLNKDYFENQFDSTANLLPSGEGNIKFFDNEKSFGVKFDFSGLKGRKDMEGTIEIEKGEDATFINVFDIAYNKEDSQADYLPDDRKSVMSFYLNLDRVYKFVNDISVNFGVDVFKGDEAESFFQDKLVSGNLIFEDSKVSLQFNLLSNE